MTYDADIAIYRRYPLVCIFLQQFARHQLLQCENDTVFAPDADGGAAVFHRLYGIFDLEVAAVGGEDGI